MDVYVRLEGETDHVLISVGERDTVVSVQDKAAEALGLGPGDVSLCNAESWTAGDGVALCDGDCIAVKVDGKKKAAAELAAMGKIPSCSGLFEASRRGDRGLMELYLDAGVDANSGAKRNTEKPHAVLFAAVASSDADCVVLLLDRGCNINTTTSLGNSALHIASQHGHGHIVELLISRGIELTQSCGHEVDTSIG